MGDAVTSQTITDTDRYAVFKFTNISDGTGETDVLKVDVSGLSGYAADDTVDIIEVAYCIPEGAVRLIWDGASDAIALILGGSGHLDFYGHLQAPITNNATTPTGDILLTTDDFVAGSSYSIILKVRKNGFEA